MVDHMVIFVLPIRIEFYFPKQILEKDLDRRIGGSALKVALIYEKFIA